MGYVAESSRNLSQNKGHRHKMKTRMVGCHSGFNYRVDQVRCQCFGAAGSGCLYCSDAQSGPRFTSEVNFHLSCK